MATPVIVPALAAVLFSTLSTSAAMGIKGSSKLLEVPLHSADASSALVSSTLDPQLVWNELIVSWNTDSSIAAAIKVEARVLEGSTTSPWYTMGLWKLGANDPGRTSINRQKDGFAEVDTDTLRLHQKADAKAEIRVTGDHLEALKLVTACFADSDAEPLDQTPFREAWGRTIEVPQKAQMDYPNGGVLCSPTSVSMILSFWGRTLQRTDLLKDVPDVQANVYDPQWPGTGNWPFNTAYAGSFSGMTGYITRLNGLRDLEELIVAGYPVATSVAYDYLKGKPKRSGKDGHLVVLIGFDDNGDPIFNDPGRNQTRQVYKRADFVRAWQASSRTVYLIYPTGYSLPASVSNVWLNSK